MKIFLKKLAWEFWPTWLIYLPMLILWPYFMLRTGKVRFWELINPGLENGGLIGDSKSKPLSQLPKKNIPIDFIINNNITQKNLLQKIRCSGITFPLIVKPDSGTRGKGVKKINNERELKKYFENLEKYNYLGILKIFEKFIINSKKNKQNDKIIIQEYINKKKEFGIFYVKNPSSDRGKIVSFIEKEFPHVKGNGVDNIFKLISDDSRLFIYKKKYFKQIKNIKYIPKANEIIKISSLGNHYQGTQIHDKSSFINNELISVFNEISDNIDGFYFGRYDVKADTIQDIFSGNFKILEVNGANAEPLHMYDSKVKPIEGWSIVIKSWIKAFNIAMKNKKNRFKK